MKISKTRTQKLNRKRVRALCRLWTDTDQEYDEYCGIIYLKELAGATYAETKLWLITKELEKCVVYKSITQDGMSRLLSMYNSFDPSTYSMALEMIHGLRERRLNNTQ